MARWNETKEFSAGFYRLMFLYRVYRLFGRKALQIAVLPVMLTGFAFMRGARRASFQYFTRLYAFTGDPAHKPTLSNIFKHIYSFTDALLDKMAAWNGDITYNDMDFKTPDERQKFQDCLNRGQGVFFMCSHLGNAEILRALNLKPDAPFKVNAFMEVSQTEGFNSFINHINPHASINLYSTKNIGIDTACIIKDKTDLGEIVVMAGDRVPAFNSGGTIPMEFLGAAANFPTGAFRFAKALECEVFFLVICKNKKRYDVHIKAFNIPKGRKAYLAMMQDYVNWLQDLTLLYPYQWYNFFRYWE